MALLSNPSDPQAPQYREHGNILTLGPGDFKYKCRIVNKHNHCVMAKDGYITTLSTTWNSPFIPTIHSIAEFDSLDPEIKK